MSEETDKPMDTDALSENLRRVIGGLVRAVRMQAGTPTSAQSETLGLLDREGPMSIADLAQRRNVKHQSMRLVVAQLEDDGLTSRMADAEDRRRQRIAITDSGRTALSASRLARTEWISKSLRHRFTSAELNTLREAIVLLERLSEADDQ